MLPPYRLIRPLSGIISEEQNAREQVLWGNRSRMRERGVAVSINSTRRMLYMIARLLGDVNAVQKGKVGKRVARRLTGRATGRALGRMFR
jgi:hypothetical protein